MEEGKSILHLTDKGQASKMERMSTNQQGKRGKPNIKWARELNRNVLIQKKASRWTINKWGDASLYK